MSKDLFIIGAGGAAKDIYLLAKDCKVGFVV